MRIINFRNSICRDGESADSVSKIKYPVADSALQKSQEALARANAREKSGGAPPDSSRGKIQVTCNTEKLSARKNQPFEIFGNQLAHSAFPSCPP